MKEKEGEEQQEKVSNKALEYLNGDWEDLIDD
jgi:hypothetical protein